MFGSGMPRRMAKAKDVDPDLARHRRELRAVRHRQRLRLRPGLAEMPRARHRADLPYRRPRLGLRNSPTNFTYNHIGHFAAAGHAIAKGLFLGGVTRRFPDLRFAFLEGGVGWGCQLFGDLIEHWERRGAKGIADMDPRSSTAPLLHEPGREVRLRRHRRRARQARRLADPEEDEPDRRRRRSSTISPPARSPARRTGSISTPSRTTSAARPTTG